MMPGPLQTLLDSRDCLMADGATGTNLFDMGLMAGDAPELWNITEPARITALYSGAVDAGSDIILTNSFGGNAARLALHGAQGQVHELNYAAAALARDVADRAGRPVIVAGSVGPTGDMMVPLGNLTHDSAVEMFHEQAAALKDGGADVGWLETISAADELRAAAEGFARAGLPWCGTMSFDTAGRTMMGVTATDMAALMGGLDQPPIAFGANCGVGASDLLRTILGITAQAPDLPIIAKGNAGIPKYHDGHIHYDGTPELMADYAVLARDCGARIIGGCCGTTPAHLQAMRGALEAHDPGPPPTLAAIEKALGPFSSPSDGTGRGASDAPKRRRRKRP